MSVLTCPLEDVAMAKPKKSKKTGSKSPGRIQAAVVKQVFVSDPNAPADPPKRPKRRPSFGIAGWINLLSWGCFFWVLRQVGKAMPEEKSFFTRLFDLDVRSQWNMELVDLTTTWMFVLSGVALLTMGFGVARNKGRYRINEILALILAVCACSGGLFLLNMQR